MVSVFVVLLSKDTILRNGVGASEGISSGA